MKEMFGFMRSHGKFHSFLCLYSQFLHVHLYPVSELGRLSMNKTKRHLVGLQTVFNLNKKLHAMDRQEKKVVPPAHRKPHQFQLQLWFPI